MMPIEQDQGIILVRQQRRVTPVVSDGGRSIRTCFKMARLNQVPLAAGGPAKLVRKLGVE